MKRKKGSRCAYVSDSENEGSDSSFDTPVSDYEDETNLLPFYIPQNLTCQAKSMDMESFLSSLKDAAAKSGLKFASGEGTSKNTRHRNVASGEGTSRNTPNKKGIKSGVNVASRGTPSSKKSKAKVHDSKNTGFGSVVSSGPSPKTRFNVKLFYNVIDKLDPRKKKVINRCAFGSLLRVTKCSAPISFASWIARQVDVKLCEIVFDRQSIKMDPKSVFDILGIPIGGSDIEVHCSVGKLGFSELFPSNDISSVDFFVNLLMQNKLDDEMTVRCFMTVALAIFLCPSSTGEVSPFYLEPLVRINDGKTWNWSKFVFEWLMIRIKNFQRSLNNGSFNHIYLGGCLYYLCVLYLDHLKFGKKDVLSPNLPRIDVWKDDMIKEYSSYDCISPGVYGKRPFKLHRETCYFKGKNKYYCDQTQGIGSEYVANPSVKFKDDLDIVVNHSLCPQVIFLMTSCRMVREFLIYQTKALVLLKLVKIFLLVLEQDHNMYPQLA